jgi:murein DD-endopeptidase MepM/ murein hydrolase activator NlpD
VSPNLVQSLRSPQTFRRIAAGVASVFALGATIAFGTAPRTGTDADAPAQALVRETVAIVPFVQEAPERFVQTERVRRGDTLGAILSRTGAADAEFISYVAKHPVARRVLQFQTGRTVLVELDASGQVHRYVYRLLRKAARDDTDLGEGDLGQRVVIERTATGFDAFEEDVPVEKTVEMKSIVIQSSLFAATEAANIPDNIASRIADIFDGEVDFNKELRRGDRLRVVYETLREPGSLEAPLAGRVLAVELLTKGKRYEAVWFERVPGSGRGEYFTFDGQSLKQGFLRNPLEFSRLTSGFTENRLHPILREWRAHKGVDFAAPIGTRVRAAGDGTVEFIGTQRGYGNVIVIRHSPSYSTLYAHLNDFSDGLKFGDRVSQGTVIGFVGMTGWATGPHLHYEFRINNESVDPMTVALPNAEPLRAADAKRLSESSRDLRRQLAQLDVQRLARFE